MKNLCLRAQDQYGADVNLLLLCAWLDTQQQPFAEQAAQALLVCSLNQKRNIIGPLRAKRIALAKGSSAYKIALEEELVAEKTAQQAFVDILNDFGGAPKRASRSWLNWYWHHIGTPPMDVFGALNAARSEIENDSPALG